MSLGETVAGALSTKQSISQIHSATEETKARDTRNSRKLTRAGLKPRHYFNSIISKGRREIEVPELEDSRVFLQYTLGSPWPCPTFQSQCLHSECSVHEGWRARLYSSASESCTHDPAPCTWILAMTEGSLPPQECSIF